MFLVIVFFMAPQRCRVEKSLLWENIGFLAAISFGLRHGRLG